MEKILKQVLTVILEILTIKTLPLIAPIIRVMMQLNKKNRKYWQGRFEQLQESLLNKSDTYYDDLDRIYKMANMDIQKEIDAWYRRFAKNNCISYLDAKKLLNTNELKEFPEGS